MRIPRSIAILFLSMLSSGSADGQDEGPMRNARGCSAMIRCPDRSERLPMVIEGYTGPPGLRGPTGPWGAAGPRGWIGPPGRDGFSARPASFYAELKQLFSTNDENRPVRPWIVSDSWNPADVSNYFSEESGVFTVPHQGLYQFYVTIAVSSARAAVYIAKNGAQINSLWVEALIQFDNRTVAWGWATGSTECLVSCQAGDQISLVAAYRSDENFNSQLYGYSYTTFSGYMFSLVEKE